MESLSNLYPILDALVICMAFGMLQLGECLRLFAIMKAQNETVQRGKNDAHTHTRARTHTHTPSKPGSMKDAGHGWPLSEKKLLTVDSDCQAK